ncbi:hypothetical protein EY643_05395 [Halioglobus maricola]|uniref:DUF4760 domain-containing protein n=1 Tax=Halioglobus maricola TaxID=2601894 RepID=A0A5P9NJI0_9GAMM|nr:hypothetical protein [Halioglobus maricola]QFU75128.1 hypothetical protein EY643_05395 [Halioglobus maricola]
MKESKTGRWAQALGFLGVIASLLFVAYELKQSRDIATADVYLATLQLEMEAYGFLFAEDTIRPVVDKLYTDEELLPGERRLLLEFTDMWTSLSDAVHFQYQLGLVPEEVWEAERAHLTDLLAVQCYSEFFQQWGNRNRASFVADIADILEAAPRHEGCFDG